MTKGHITVLIVLIVLFVLLTYIIGSCTNKQWEIKKAECNSKGGQMVPVRVSATVWSESCNK
jgi:Flp pilus assembly protein CpaB